MDSKVFGTYLKTVHEFVYDEDKIVTYKWLGNKLGIHVNVAKDILKKFVANATESPTKKISPIYLMGGCLLDSSNMCFNLVHSSDLDNIRKQFQSVTIEHVFSVQKCENPDIESLFTVDKLNNSSCIGRIKLDVNIKREAVNRPEAIQSVISQTQNTVKKEPENLKIKNGKKEKQSLAAMFESQNKKAEVSKARGSSSNEDKKVPDDSKAGDTKAVKKPLKAKGSFFGTGNNSTKTEKKDAITKENEPDNTDSFAEEIKMEVDEEAAETVTEENTKKSKNSKKNKRGSKQTCLAKDKQDDLPTKKKRKRIFMTNSDSSEDDMFVKERSVSPEFNQPAEEDIIPATPDIQPKVGRKRTKVVDVTYYDEDQFLNSRKEIVYLSDNELGEDECPTEKPKEPVKIAIPTEDKKSVEKKSPKSGQPKKQATLMSFFQKR